MLTRGVFLLVSASLFLIATPSRAQERKPVVSAEVLQQRKLLSEQGTFLYQPSLHQASPPDASTFGDALDIPPSMLVEASISGPATAAGVFAGLGVIKPRRGPTFVVLSTGVAGTSSPEPGTDFPPADVEGDRVTLKLTLNLPPGVNRLSFDFNFLSAEYPDFIGTAFNDTFRAVLSDASGVREVARASVNSAAFAPASASNSGGSGFDIFTDDPAGVDLEFGTGLPDAGVTGFQSVNVPVVGGGMVTLEFSIEDLGDGILDSAVIVDNLVLSSLEVVDPNPVFLSGGAIVTDAEILAQGGEQRGAAAADGVTRVLVRSRVPGPGATEFCLVNASAPGDGGLAIVGGTGRADCVNAPAVNTTQGFMTFAVYQTPDRFNRGGDESLGERLLGFRGRFTPSVGTMIESEIPFTLVRPPVVLVHGLWSNGGTWTFPLVDDPRVSVTLADYKGTNASHFATNLSVPSTYIREAITRERLNKTAATQVDIVGHSMGGILSRNHVTRPNYKSNENFGAGDLHSLMTLNTPHTGSPLGNLIEFIRAIPFVGNLFEAAMTNIEHPVDLGALEDLAKGSAAINAIQQTPVPSHALAGIGGSDALELLPGRLGTIYKVINFFADSSTLFQGLQHDGIVGRQSQEGGMPVNAISVFGGVDSIHIFVTGSTNYSARLIELLNSSVTGPLFAQFPAPASVSSSSFAEPGSPAVHSAAQGRSGASLAAAGGLTITSPVNGTVVAAGSTVHVVVALGAGVTVDRVLLTGPGVALVDAAAPFEFDLTIPSVAVGDFTLVAVGNDNAGNFFISDAVTLTVQPPAALTAVSVLPRDPILFAVGETRTLTALGLFADGITRNISGPGTGTTYMTSSPGIAAVSPEGVVTATGVGTATVVAKNGVIQDSLSVRVVLANQSPVANAGPDQNVPVGQLVTLNGTASFDPDSGPAALSFLWAQVAGPAASLTGATSPAPTFTPLLPGSYVFGLVVSDGQADSVPDNVTITAGSTFVDVGVGHPFFGFIEALARAGITGGCSTSPPQYCPAGGVTRGQMAVFLLRGIHGAGYQPPGATGTTFTDVPVTHPFAKWIEQLAREGITGGCSTAPPRYCPDDGVTRGQMAVFLLRAKHGAGYLPPAATGTMFSDVPVTHPFARWIEQLAREGITGGCGATTYCPDAAVTRGQMAVFLVRTFNLPM